MPRTKITTSVLPYNGGLETVTWTAADATNHHYMVDDGQTLLLLRNSDATTKTVTVLSVADPRLKRLGDAQIVVAAAAGGASGIAMFGLFPSDAWRQPSSTNVNINVSAATGLSLAAVRVTKR